MARYIPTACVYNSKKLLLLLLHVYDEVNTELNETVRSVFSFFLRVEHVLAFIFQFKQKENGKNTTTKKSAHRIATRDFNGTSFRTLFPLTSDSKLHSPYIIRSLSHISACICTFGDIPRNDYCNYTKYVVRSFFFFKKFHSRRYYFVTTLPRKK